MKEKSGLNRRQFVLSAAGAASIGVVWGTDPATRPMRLGGPIFVKSEDPSVLAQAHQDLGYRAAYAPNLKVTETERIKATVRAFAERDIVIAEVGAWVNMLDPDPTTRKKNISFVIEKLALAEELGARCCVDIAGSFNPEDWAGPHPENFSQRFFEATVENIRMVIDAVDPRRTSFSIEMMGWSMPSSPDEYLKLIKAVDRAAFGVHVDVCNMINSPSRIYQNSALIRECFAKLGPKIVSCHAKDVAWVSGSQIHFEEVIPGRGEIDYATYLKEISRLELDVPLMLEHLKTAKEYDEGRAYIQAVAKKSGLSFS